MAEGTTSGVGPNGADDDQTYSCSELGSLKLADEVMQEAGEAGESSAAQQAHRDACNWYERMINSCPWKPVPLAQLHALVKQNKRKGKTAMTEHERLLAALPAEPAVAAGGEPQYANAAARFEALLLSMPADASLPPDMLFFVTYAVAEQQRLIKAMADTQTYQQLHARDADTIRKQAQEKKELELRLAALQTDMEQRLAAKDAELAAKDDQLQEQGTQLSSLEAFQVQQQGKNLLSAIAKPAKFDGQDRTKADKIVREWTQQTTSYIEATGVAEGLRVPVAQSYLAGEALRLWLAARLLIVDREPTLKDLMDCMISNFAPASKTKSMRTQLDQLKQEGDFSKLSAYIAQFDLLCSHIEDMSNSEKLHRFTSGLRGAARSNLVINPHTLSPYTDYLTMRAAALNHAASAEMLTQFQERRQQSSKGASSSNGALSADKKRKGHPAAAAAAGSSTKKKNKAATDVEVTNKAGVTVTRTTHVLGFCKRGRICAFCYSDTHDHSSKCVAKAAAPGFPEGFKP